jgi:hypothetical protein
MTREQNNVVRLSARDWIAIVGLALTVSGAALGGFMHHDRLLMRVITQQESINARLDKIERQLEPRR